jgi:hypothetical protein
VIRRTATLTQVAFIVGATLRRNGIRAVLTGGACVAAHTGGAYLSRDIDFVVEGRPTQAELDRVMKTLGFRRVSDRYVSPSTEFYVEFPPGPLAVGGSLASPVERRSRFGRVLTLSATDSCKDRLAAAIHWNDRQSLELAVAIARRHDVALLEIAKWCRAEGGSAVFDEFVRSVTKRTRARRH